VENKYQFRHWREEFITIELNQIYLIFMLEMSWLKTELFRDIYELWPSPSIRRPLKFYIFNFFSRMGYGISTKLSTNVPHNFPTKCYYFLDRSEIQDGRHKLWLTDTFLISSNEQLKRFTPNVPHWIPTKC